MLITAISHVHSASSYDANWPLSRIARLFKIMNCQLLLMTEHDKYFDAAKWQSYRSLCERESTENFLIIPGIEYSDPSNTIHILVWGDLPFLGYEKHTEDILKRVKASGGISVLAHPLRKMAYKLIKPGWFSLLYGIEVWNRKFDGFAPSSEARLLGDKYELVPFFGLDFHQVNQLAPLVMKIELNGTMTHERVISALRSRSCFAQLFGMSENFTNKVVQTGLLGTIEKTRLFLRDISRFRK